MRDRHRGTNPAASQGAPPEEALARGAEVIFDDLGRLACHLAHAPLAAMSLIEEGHRWFRSRGGISQIETPRAMALCAETIRGHRPLLVPDALRDERFPEDSPAPSGIRFFAGFPIAVSGASTVGTVAVMDREPRELDAAQRESLEALARQAGAHLEARLQAELLARRLREREEADGPLRLGAELFGEILSGAGEGIAVYDRLLRCVAWGRFLEELTGIAAGDALGRPAARLFPHLRDRGIAGLLERALSGETMTSPDTAHRVPRTGETRWVSGTFSPRRDANGQITGVIEIVRDMTERRRAEEANPTTEIGFRRLVEESLVGIYVIQDGRYRYVNPRLAATFGYTPEELLGLDSVMDLVAEEDRPAVRDNIRKRLEGELETIRYSFRALRRDGERFDVEIHGALTEFQGRPAVQGALLDISDRRRAEAQIVEQAYNDPLTKLPNRIRFMERLRLQLAQARRQKRRLAIVYLDLDRFKSINDTWGHGVGDTVLQSLALRLKRRVREVDTVARVGGDEFVILMPDVRQTENLSVIAQKLLAAVSRPLEVEGRAIQVTTSIGIACYPEDAEDSESLLRNADTAMYRAKELGRNGFQLCTPELTSRAVERLSLQMGLAAALERGEMVLHYQPIVSLVSGRIVGLEALLRWRHEGGFIRPGAFIAVAEESGLILPLGEHVLRAACRSLKAWQRIGLPDLRVSVNVSARQFREAGLTQMIESALRETELSPECLEVEITESVAMESAEIVVVNLEALRGRGVRIAIDDFGTGYSSLNYLKRYPIHSLKIDRSFVTDVATSDADAGIVRAIIEMAHGLKLNVVAEGVETKDQFLHLQRYGCDQMQGYWVSPPLPADGVDELLAREVDLWARKT